MKIVYKISKILFGFVAVAFVIGILREIIPVEWAFIRTVIFGSVILGYMKFIGLWNLVIKYRNRSKSV